jgi:hypothetical protein
MEAQEISSRFDYALQKAKGGLILDEYQKSLLLTKAQAIFVEQMLAQYEYGDALRHVLDVMLITVVDTNIIGTGKDTYQFGAKDDILSIVFEIVNDSTEGIETIPLDFNDIHDARVNPFRKPYKKLAYRITDNQKFTIFSSEIVTEYSYIYCKEPVAIVLEAIPTELAIQGIDVETTSELPYDSILKVIDIAVGEAINEAARLSPKQETKKE